MDEAPDGKLRESTHEGDAPAEAYPELRELPADRYVDFVPVGEGGMGIVYWAVDSDLRREVAFKVIRPPRKRREPDVTPPLPYGLRTPEEESDSACTYRGLTARFLQEAWVTGGMEHPGIVPVYDIGRTEQGVPYYTMRFVRGSRTLKAALDEVRDGGFEARLPLLEPFLKVCDTIRYAHSRRVIHRDLKPDNVALGEFGEVVVLDWGLARLLDDGDAQEPNAWREAARALRSNAELGTVATAMGTPGYMAPEAAAGRLDEMDERADVYGLGVMLYEILAGRTPFQVRDLEAYAKRVLSEDPPDPRETCAEVPEALARLCRHALAPRVTDRTRGAEGIAAQVRAWQAQRAVDREIEGLLREADADLAAAADVEETVASKRLESAAGACQRVLRLRPGHEGATERVERARAIREQATRERDRWTRRRLVRRVAWSALAVAVAAGVVVAYLLDVQAREATAARARAEQSDRSLGAMTGFLAGEMRERLEPLGRLDLMTRLGEEVRTYFDTIRVEDLSPAGLRDGADALRRLGDVHRLRGELPAADGAYLQSLAFAEHLQARPGAGTDAGPRVSRAWAGRGRVLVEQGRPTRAVAMLTDHLARLERASPDPSALGEHAAALAEAHDMLGRAHKSMLQRDAAAHQFGEALRLTLPKLTAEEASGGARRTYVDTTLELLPVLRALGRAEEASRRLDEAAALVAAGRAQAPRDVRWQVLETQLLQARHEGAFGDDPDLDRARQRLVTILDAVELLRARDPENATYQAWIANLETRIGRVARARWRTSPAGEETDPGGTPPADLDYYGRWRHAHGIYRVLCARDPTSALWARGLVGVCHNLAELQQEVGLTDADVRGYREEALTHAERCSRLDAGNVHWHHVHAFALDKCAGINRHVRPALARAQWTQALQICHEQARTHAERRTELVMLQTWIVGDLAVLESTQGNRAAQLDVLRRSQAFLEEMLEALPRAAASVEEARQQTEWFVRALASGNAAEVAEARAVLDRVVASLESRGDEGAEAWGDELRGTLAGAEGNR